jgi:hypothetical protein
MESLLKPNYVLVDINWLATGEMFYTKDNNIKAPSLDLICKWTVEAWKLIPEDHINNSFK